MKGGVVVLLLVALSVPAAGDGAREQAGLIVFASDRTATLIKSEARAVDLRSRRSKRLGFVPEDVDPRIWIGWSADGRSFAYVDSRGDLYVARPGRRPRRIARRHGETDDRPAWSPSGRRIAFFGRDRGLLSVYVVGTRGRRPKQVARRIADAPDTTPGDGLAWSPDERRLAIVSSRGGSCRLAVAEVRTRRARVMGTGRGCPAFPAWSPDGRRIAFRAQVPGEAATVRTVDLGTGIVRRVHRTGGVPLWSPDGRSLAIDEKHRLWVYRRGTARLVATHSAASTSPVWSPDSRRLVFQHREDVVVVEAGPRRTRRLLRETRTYVPELPPAWSGPNRVVYVGRRRDPGDLDLHVVHPDGSGTRALTRNGVAESDPVWSPDARRIAYDRARGRSQSDVSDVYVMNADGSSQRLVAVNGSSPSWSPDGSRVAFSRLDDIWTVHDDGRDPVQLTSGPERDREPAWSPRGGEIAFSRSGGPLTSNSELYAVPTEGGNPRKITDEGARNVGCFAHLALNPAWSPDGRRLAYELETFGSRECGPTRGHRVEVTVIRADGSSRAAVTDGGYWDAVADDGALAPTWSPDGERIAFVSSVSDMSPEYEGWSRIGIVAASGGPFRLITPKSYGAFAPAWRP